MNKRTTSALLLLLLFCINLRAQDSPGIIGPGIRSFLNGDLKQAVQLQTHAIKQDSTIFINYYLRGYFHAYLSDTANCITDFFKAVDVKKRYPHYKSDTLTDLLMFNEPRRDPTLCGQSLDHESGEFFQLWRGTWLLLTNNKYEACFEFKEAEKSGLWQLKPYTAKYCR